MDRCCPPFKCSEIVTGGTQCECPSTTVPIVGITTGPTVKIPVVLAELQLQVNLDSIITLPEPALEIKDIKKRVSNPVPAAARSLCGQWPNNALCQRIHTKKH